MITRTLPVDAPGAFELALDYLKRGEVIAIPTDTVYGVAADGLNPNGIEGLFAAKDRPRNKPIPLLLADQADLIQVALLVPPEADALGRVFWPGALTLVVRARDHLPPILRAAGDSVAVRVPDHRVPRELARSLGHPLAASSANISGGPNPSTAEQVERQLRGRIGLILDAGFVGEGVPSTVIDLTVSPPKLIRVGAINASQIEHVLGREISVDVNWD